MIKVLLIICLLFSGHQETPKNINVIVKYWEGHGEEVKSYALNLGGKIRRDLPRHHAFSLSIKEENIERLNDFEYVEYIEADVEAEIIIGPPKKLTDK